MGSIPIASTIQPQLYCGAKKAIDNRQYVSSTLTGWTRFGSKMCGMSIFYIDVENEFTQQSFLLEADDFISAAMLAFDFVRKLDKKVSEDDGDDFVRFPFKINTINDTSALWANDEGISKFLEKMKECAEE